VNDILDRRNRPKKDTDSRERCRLCRYTGTDSEEFKYVVELSMHISDNVDGRGQL